MRVIENMLEGLAVSHGVKLRPVVMPLFEDVYLEFVSEFWGRDNYSGIRAKVGAII